MKLPAAMYSSLALFGFSLAMYASENAEQGKPVRPLAQNYVVLERTPNISNPLYTPSICAGENGRLIAAYEFGHHEVRGAKGVDGENARIATSDDGGKTWTVRAKENMTHGRIFKAGKSFYYLGHRGNLRIMRSDDNGQNWTKAVNISPNDKKSPWHQSACNVWYDKGNVYLVMEYAMIKGVKCWPVSVLAPVVMRAKETDDLTKPENWTFSEAVCMATIIKDFDKNELPQLDYFGVPFYKQNYPAGHVRIAEEEEHKWRSFAPLGMLETNIVQIKDPAHIWHDATGKTFHLFMRANTGRTGYAALLKAVEKDDGSIKIELEKAPSGKNMLFVPFPGGQMRFHICYDEQTKLYWLLGTQATDSMIKPSLMPKERYGLPDNERQRLVLHYSKNMVDWCFAGLVAKTEGESLKESRHYASMAIDGNDLVILSRSGDKNAKSAHNGNIITFHRVKNFRDLVY